MTNILYLIVGLVGLWVGTELIVKGASMLAKRYRLKESFIGLSVLAFGTDLPELAIMFDAALSPQSASDGAGIILGSAVGSAVGQISFVLGIVGLLGTLYMSRGNIIRHGSILCLAILLLFIFAIDGVVSRFEGAVLIFCYAGYFALLLKEKSHIDLNFESQLTEPALKAWFMIMPGFILLLGNAELTVHAALSLAEEYGLSSSSVAVVIIGLGSSLPELSLSVMALARKKAGLSLGNLIGSNILDTLLVPGIGAVIAPLVADRDFMWLDLPVLLFVTAFAIYGLASTRRGLQRGHAVILILTYIGFIAFRFGREVIDGGGL